MSLLERSFGAGGSEPYAAALRTGDALPLRLQGIGTDRAMDVARWRADADDVDIRVLRRVRGPLLDVGCGPARMVSAARTLGLEAWGVDVSEVAVAYARERGIPVMRASIFDRLPRQSPDRWRTVLLLDGNIGIGGDVPALLDRCRRLITDEGEIVVELHPDDDRDHRFAGRLVDASGRESAAFPWAEVGLGALVARADGVGLEVAQDWVDGDRLFCTLRVIAR